MRRVEDEMLNRCLRSVALSRMLFEFAEKETNHHATYALSGISKTSGALEIRLVPQEKLDGG
jgi:hypothetical protein